MWERGINKKKLRACLIVIKSKKEKHKEVRKENCNRLNILLLVDVWNYFKSSI